MALQELALHKLPHAAAATTDGVKQGANNSIQHDFTRAGAQRARRR